MKIEIAESLACSWLRHIKKCQVVQTNWKPSDEWNMQNRKESEQMINDAAKFFSIARSSVKDSPDKEPESIFKKSANMLQILRQTESDVIGIHIGDKGDITVYAVEVAFHMQGLNYSGGKKVTKRKIIAKAIRSAMSVYCYLGRKKAELSFISPKVNRSTITALEGVQNDINRFFEKNRLEYKFKLIFNDDFCSEIWMPVLGVVNAQGAYDTSELCARALGIHKLMSKYSSDMINAPQRNRCNLDHTSANKIPTETVSVCDEEPRYLGRKVGEIAAQDLCKWLEHKCTEEQAFYFLDKENTKREFKLSFPLLRRESDKRYYKTSLTIHGKSYYLCSQWTKRHRNSLIQWLKDHNG